MRIWYAHGIMPKHLQVVLMLLVVPSLMSVPWISLVAEDSPRQSSKPLTEQASEDALEVEFRDLQPLLATYCIKCHSSKVHEGELDLERFRSIALVKQDVKPWESVIIQLETGEMPPRKEQQPTETERKRLLDWTRQLLERVARSWAGDPGRVPLHRLSHAEYDNSIRDLTGVDLHPTREFPADGAAGEGFTNASEALGMSPALMTKYVNSSKEIASHMVLLPDGFRFSPSSTKRDWTDESLAALRTFYSQWSTDGKLPLRQYLAALVESRNALRLQQLTLAELATQKRLSPRYLETLWHALNDQEPSMLLEGVRRKWRSATTQDVDAIALEVESWTNRLWDFPAIGSYRNEFRQVAKAPPIVESLSISIPYQPMPGESDVTLHLFAKSLVGEPVGVRFRNPRFTGPNLPTLSLSDYPEYGSLYEADLPAIFAQTTAYLSAVRRVAHEPSLSTTQLASNLQLDEQLLNRWISVLNLQPQGPGAEPPPGRTVPAIAMKLLDEPAPNATYPLVNGWRFRGSDLPVVVSNASDQVVQVPGTISSHGIAMHPLPSEFVAVSWKSPFTGRLRINGKVIDAHAACGNGFAWWLELKTPTRSSIVAEGNVDLGKSMEISTNDLNIQLGDQLILGIDARDANHVCDLTEVSLTFTELDVADSRVWDLAHDVAEKITEGNPLSDSLMNEGVWSFLKGESKSRGTGAVDGSAKHPLLDRWRKAASDPATEASASSIAEELQTLLAGKRPSADSVEERKLYDALASWNGALLKGLELTQFRKSPDKSQPYGLPSSLFGGTVAGESVDGDDFLIEANQVVAVRLPARLFLERKFEVDCTINSAATSAVVQFQVLTTAPPAVGLDGILWDGVSPVVARSRGAGEQKFLADLAAFRRLFPPNICYPHVIPLDEVVCLKTFHREDQPLQELFLDDAQTVELERLWREHRFVTKFPLVENEYLPLFIGFVTQDQPQSLVQFFEGKRPVFQAWADEFERDYLAAAPLQMKQLEEFASRAYRRPLTETESQGFSSLYQFLRREGVPHEEVMRSLLSRVLISPSFLLHVEQSPAGVETAPVDHWELASRLSYFLWGSLPDDELRQLAVDGQLDDPEVLAQQTRRMLQDERARYLAIEFGTQWIHVRGFELFAEKNETLFPMFDAQLREDMSEEAIQFFRDLFQQDRPVVRILDADYTFLNERLAKHYGISGVSGSEMRRVDDVQKQGRGGILGFGAVLSKQAGASRTSPVLRGNWVIETVLGERLPRPPPNVPQLPESDLDNDRLTMREIVAKHVSDVQCASCHQRIDPFGLALEAYDPIGRRLVSDPSEKARDLSATLRDGTEFFGIDGLRNYLLTSRKDVFVRTFHKRLLGFALRRSVTLSDQLLLDEMFAATDGGERGVGGAVQAIVQSPQFRRIRGASLTDDTTTRIQAIGTEPSSPDITIPGVK